MAHSPRKPTPDLMATFDQLDTVLREGTVDELVALALAARVEAEHGQFCGCSAPSMKGGILICGACLHPVKAPATPIGYPLKARIAVLRAVMDSRHPVELLDRRATPLDGRTVTSS